MYICMYICMYITVVFETLVLVPKPPKFGLTGGSQCPGFSEKMAATSQAYFALFPIV